MKRRRGGTLKPIDLLLLLLLLALLLTPPPKLDLQVLLGCLVLLDGALNILFVFLLVHGCHFHPAS